jgi:hypothetical protein
MIFKELHGFMTQDTHSHPYFPGLVLPSGQKLTLGTLVTITIEVVPFRSYAPFPALLPFFKCIQKVVFCEGVHHRLRFCHDHLSCVKMVAFQFYLQSGRQKSRLRGQSYCFWSKIPWSKRKCGTVRCRHARASYFVDKFSGRIFMQSM